MKPRAISDLAQLSDSELFRELANGMLAVVRNARSLTDDANALSEAGRARSVELLHAVAKEEAAKFFILLDAARCARSGATFARQLKRFNEHMAKGLYARYVGLAPASYGEVLRFLEGERQELYLDGPNDVDWIFRNEILQGREGAFYVDYVEAEGEHFWMEPQPHPMAHRQWDPVVLAHAERLLRAGFGTPDALAVVASVWRGVTFQPNDHWSVCNEWNEKTLHALASKGLLTDEGQAEAGLIAWDWLFPLHEADLQSIKVQRQDLESIRSSRQGTEW